MGCNNSVDSEILIVVELNPPVFKTDSVSFKSTLRTTLSDFCKKVISSNITTVYANRCLSFQISCKGKQYSLNDFSHIYDLRLERSDSIKIEGLLLDARPVEVTLKYHGSACKELVEEVSSSSQIRSFINKTECRVLLGYLELDLDQRLEDYGITSKTRLNIIEDNSMCEEIQIWKIKQSGLVLEAICMNCNCTAYKQRISINLGIGEFNLNSEASLDNLRNCPVCEAALGRVSKVGYAHCCVSYTITVADGSARQVSDKIVNYVECDSKTLPTTVTVVKFA